MRTKLIDHYRFDVCKIGDKWYAAKPLYPWSIKRIIQNIIHAWLVLIGKATAVHFKEEEKNNG